VSRETVRSISELLREAREGGASTDPEFFDRKAAVFDAIAAEDPHLAATAVEMADTARARARHLRGRS
jgi:hypothetical protein